MIVDELIKELELTDKKSKVIFVNNETAEAFEIKTVNIYQDGTIEVVQIIG